MSQLWTATIIVITFAVLWKASEYLEEHQQEKFKRRQQARRVAQQQEEPLTKEQVMKIVDERISQLISSKKPL
jgi:hypothetical protein